MHQFLFVQNVTKVHTYPIFKKMLTRDKPYLASFKNNEIGTKIFFCHTTGAILPVPMHNWSDNESLVKAEIMYVGFGLG